MGGVKISAQTKSTQGSQGYKKMYVPIIVSLPFYSLFGRLFQQAQILPSSALRKTGYLEALPHYNCSITQRVIIMANSHTEFHIPRHHSKHFTLKSLFHTHKNPDKYVHYLHFTDMEIDHVPKSYLFSRPT